MASTRVSMSEREEISRAFSEDPHWLPGRCWDSDERDTVARLSVK